MTFEPNVEYRVVFARVAVVRGVKFLPRDSHVMLGSMLAEIVAANGEGVIASATPKG